MPVGEAITILYKGGRLPTWHQLPAEQKRAFEQAHVDLMLRIASQHDLRRLEGFRLIAPQGAWERFWTIHFPTLAGAEAWIQAEMEPPYGRYGFYDYQLARQIKAADAGLWPGNIADNTVALKGDPHRVPDLAIDRDSIVVFLYEWDGPGDNLKPNDPANTLSRARMHGVTRLERFDLIAPGASWDRVWLAELPTSDLAEAWIGAEAAAGEGDATTRHFQLTRKWAPGYFASWIQR